MSKTNAVRQLDLLKIPYELSHYEVDEQDLTATSVAQKIGQEVKQVFKTLVVRGDKTGIFVAVIPGDAEVDLKLAAKVSGNKSVAFVAVKEILGLTGYIRGGCSPLAMKKKYTTYIHPSCMNYPYVFVSAGVRGTQIKIMPSDLIKACSAQVIPLFADE